MAENDSKKSVDEQFEDVTDEVSTLGVGSDDVSDDELFGEDDSGSAEEQSNSTESGSTAGSTSSTGKTDTTSGTSSGSDTRSNSTTLKEERNQVPVMLSEDEETQVKALYQRLQAEATANGQTIEKHRDFWSAAVTVVTDNEEQLRDELDL